MSDLDGLVSALVARLDQVERDWLTRAYHPDHASEENQHYYQTHPWWDYAETIEQQPPDGDGWQPDDRGHGLIPWVEYSDWSDARGDYVSYGRWAWRRRREEPREFVPEGDAAQVLGLVRATRDLITEWREIDSGSHGPETYSLADRMIETVARGWGVGTEHDKEDTK
jgi:hypothetical protein